MEKKQAALILLMIALVGSLGAYLYIQNLAQAYRGIEFDLDDATFSLKNGQIELMLSFSLYNPSSHKLHIPSTRVREVLVIAYRFTVPFRKILLEKLESDKEKLLSFALARIILRHQIRTWGDARFFLNRAQYFTSSSALARESRNWLRG